MTWSSSIRPRPRRTRSTRSTSRACARAYQAYTQEWERPRKLKPPGRLVSEKTLTPKKAPDELVATSVDLTPALTTGLGQSLVVIEPTRAPEKGWQRAELAVWVQSTELGVSAFIEPDQLTGWVTRLADGAPQDGVQLSLLNAGSATTDKDGLARVGFTDKPSNLLVARKGKDVAIVTERGYGYHSYARPSRSDSARWLVFDDTWAEGQDPGGAPYRSVKALYEIDCAQKRWRSVSAEFHQYNSLRGESRARRFM